MKYYKILHKDMKHYNMYYKEGLNENCEKTLLNGHCGNGLFFTSEEGVLLLVEVDCLIADVEIPKEEPIGEIPNSDIFKAHRIILKNIRPFWTVENLQQLKEDGVDLYYNDNIFLLKAINVGPYEIVQFLLENKSKDKLQPTIDYGVCKSIRNGRIDILELLLEYGADIHYHYDYPLEIAAECGQFDAVQILVERGADLKIGDSAPLAFAAFHGYFEIVTYLVEKGMDIHAQDENVLYYAIKGGNIRIVEYLLEHGAKYSDLLVPAVILAFNAGNHDMMAYLESLAQNKTVKERQRIRNFAIGREELKKVKELEKYFL